jgi:hypothetical protein
MRIVEDPLLHVSARTRAPAVDEASIHTLNSVARRLLLEDWIDESNGKSSRPLHDKAESEQCAVCLDDSSCAIAWLDTDVFGLIVSHLAASTYPADGLVALSATCRSFHDALLLPWLLEARARAIKLACWKLGAVDAQGRLPRSSRRESTVRVRQLRAPLLSSDVRALAHMIDHRLGSWSGTIRKLKLPPLCEMRKPYRHRAHPEPAFMVAELASLIGCDEWAVNALAACGALGTEGLASPTTQGGFNARATAESYCICTFILRDGRGVQHRPDCPLSVAMSAGVTTATAGELVEEAIVRAQDAVNFDTNGEFERAIELYKISIDLIKRAMQKQRCDEGIDSGVLQRFLQLYSDRISKLQRHVYQLDESALDQLHAACGRAGVVLSSDALAQGGHHHGHRMPRVVVPPES